MNKSDKGDIARDFIKLKASREPFLRRARACSVLTKPTAMPPEGADGSTDYPVPYQTTGAEGINNFASRLNTILFPVGSPWFRYVLTDDARDNASDQDALTKVEVMLSEREKKIRRYCETIKMRVITGKVCEHSIIGGNVLMYIPPTDEPLRYYCMDRYVVRRTPAGELLQVIINEDLLLSMLDDVVLAYCGLLDDKSDTDINKKATLYTSVEFDSETKFWTVKQEINGVVLPEHGIGREKIGKWAKFKKCPYVPVRWSHLDGEDWGRGYVEDILGGLIVLDILTRAVTEGAEIASLSIMGVKPGGTTKRRDLVRAKNGSYIPGDLHNDVTMLRADKGADYGVAERMIAALEEKMQRAFLMRSAVQRKGERVTSYEIRMMIQALEEQIGNVYAIFASELQPQVVGLLEQRMIALGKLDRLPEGTVETTIVTGLEALGRGQDLQKIVEFAELGEKMVGKDAMLKFIKPLKLLRMMQAALQLENDDFLLTDEEYEQMEAEAKEQMQKAQEMEMMNKMAGPAAGLIGKMIPQGGQGGQGASAQPQLPAPAAQPA